MTEFVDNHAARASAAFDMMLQAQFVNGKAVTYIATSQPKTLVPHYSRLSLTDKLAKKFLIVFDEILKKYRNAWRDRTIRLVPYDGGQAATEDVVEWIYLPEHELLSAELAPLRQHVPDLVTPNDMKDPKFPSTLRYYAAAVESWPPITYPLTFFRHYSSSKVLGTRLFGAFWDGNNVYDYMDNSAFLFDFEMDCIQVDDYLFILGQHNFHIMFRFEDAMREAATKTLEKIHKHVPISNYDELLSDTQKQLSKLLKLRHISQQDYLEVITFEDIERVILDRNLPIKIEVINGIKHVCYDRNFPWQLLALLDDDFVRSIMANRPYQSHSKSPL